MKSKDTPPNPAVPPSYAAEAHSSASFAHTVAVCAAIFNNKIGQVDSKAEWRKDLDRAIAYVLRAEIHCSRKWTPEKIKETRLLLENEYIFANLYLNDMSRGEVNFEIAKLEPQHWLFYPGDGGECDLVNFLDKKLNLKGGKDQKRKFENFLDYYRVNHFWTDSPLTFAEELSLHGDHEHGFYFHKSLIDIIVDWRKKLKKKGGIKPLIALAKKFEKERCLAMASSFKDESEVTRRKKAFWAKMRACMAGLDRQLQAELPHRTNGKHGSLSNNPHP